MKKLFFLILVLAFEFSFAQIEGGDYTGKFIEHYDYSVSRDTYLPTDEDSGWLDMEFFFDPYGEYYSVSVDGGDFTKFWYEYKGKKTFDGSKCDEYHIEDGRMLLIDYDSNELLFFYDEDSRTNIYQSLTIVSKIEKDD